MAEKKMKQVDFWIRYFKEHINTIGCVELDGLDCREVLALLQELADKKVDKPNKMEAVAQLFGKKLGEEFEVKHKSGRWYYVFCEQGLAIKIINKDGKSTEYNWVTNDMLIKLITGEAVIADE